MDPSFRPVRHFGRRRSFLDGVGAFLRAIWTERQARRLMLFAIFEAAVFGYLMAKSWALGSLALEAFAVRLGFDLVGLVSYLITVWTSKKKPSPRLSFGYGRLEVLCSFSLTLLVLVSDFNLVLSCLTQLLEPTTIALDGELPLLTGGLVVHLIGVLSAAKYTRLGNAGVPKAVEKPLGGVFGLRVTTKHLPALSALASGLLVFLSVAVVAVDPQAAAVDPLVGLVIVAVQVWSVFPICRSTAMILLQTAPESLATALDRALREVSLQAQSIFAKVTSAPHTLSFVLCCPPTRPAPQWDCTLLGSRFAEPATVLPSLPMR
eukprot:m.109442 g.109442  ORF g.109442 m.109442 type:complete len:320 (-) comp15980_c0_seq2:412-1371(-)